MNIIFALASVLSPLVFAANGPAGIWDTQQQRSLTAQEVAEIVVGQQAVLVFGEVHYCAPCAAQQVELMTALRARLTNGKLHLAMEFIDFEKQGLVDQFLDGALSQADFLAAMKWRAEDFQFYSEQMAIPQRENGEGVWAINSPRRITSQVAKGGIESLSPDDRQLLPPQFERGNDGYFARFKEVMGHVSDPAAMERYFLAQSVWDETMAWKTLSLNSFLLAEKNLSQPQVLFLQVGEFHVAFGGGLPDRLVKRGLPSDRMLTMSQVEIEPGLSDEEKRALLSDHPVYGPRARFVYLFER